MDFLHTMVRVTDVDESLRFYCEGLGLKQVRRNDYEDGRFSLIFLASKNDIARANNDDMKTGFITGLPMLELTYNWPTKEQEGQEDKEVYKGGRNFGHLAYSVENIYEKCTHLMKMGYTINRPPRDGYMAFVRSPDGVSVELLQQGERLAPQEPWADMKNIGEW
ncbi:MAG: lactoylglutathione lyase [Robiginitomaculum sp.]|nr:MAG: lactoylglutathione lyase [Robiginitomaculum sp.]